MPFIMPRRDWLKLVCGTAGGMIVLRDGTGCANYPAEDGAAFAPWVFPGTETVPVRIVARAALLAANPHNSQPWALHVMPSQIDLYADLTRGLGTIDSLLREMHIGLGCALENMVIAAGAVGLAASVSLLPDAARPTLVASVGLVPVVEVPDPLFTAIAQRHTHRGRFADAPPPAALESALQRLVREQDVVLRLLTTTADMARFRQGTIDATTVFIADGAMSRDDNAWWRQTADDILTHRDGITIDCSGNGAATIFLGKALGQPSNATANAYWLASTTGDQTTASAFGVLSSPAGNNRADQLRVGRVYQRMHLWAVSQGMAMQPLNQLAELQDREETQAHPPRFTAVLNDLVGTPGRRGQMLFRIGVPWDDARKSPRRPLEWVLA